MNWRDRALTSVSINVNDSSRILIRQKRLEPGRIGSNTTLACGCGRTDRDDDYGARALERARKMRQPVFEGGRLDRNLGTIASHAFELGIILANKDSVIPMGHTMQLGKLPFCH